MGIEISTKFCWSAGGLAVLTGLGVGIRALLAHGNEYKERVLEEHYQADESDLLAGRAMMIAFTPEDLRELARNDARQVTEEYNEKHRGEK